MRSFFRLARLAATFATATALSGCALHPIPDNVSHYRTEDIVKNVRCEVFEAVRDRIAHELSKVPAISDISPVRVLDETNFSRIKAANPGARRTAGC